MADCRWRDGKLRALVVCQPMVGRGRCFPGRRTARGQRPWPNRSSCQSRPVRRHGRTARPPAATYRAGAMRNLEDTRIPSRIPSRQLAILLNRRSSRSPSPSARGWHAIPRQGDPNRNASASAVGVTTEKIEHILPQTRRPGIEADTKDRQKFNGAWSRRGSRAFTRLGCRIPGCPRCAARAVRLSRRANPLSGKGGDGGVFSRPFWGTFPV